MNTNVQKHQKQTKQNKPCSQLQLSRRKLLTGGALGLGSLFLTKLVGTRKAAAASPTESTIDKIKRAGDKYNQIAALLVHTYALHCLRKNL